MTDASESAKTRAEELGVDIEEVEGTGASGNVKVSDVEAFAETRDSRQSDEPEGEPLGAPEPPAGEPVPVTLNPALGIGGYDFGVDAFPVDPKSSIRAGEIKVMPKEDYDRHSKVKLNGHAVIIKA